MIIAASMIYYAARHGPTPDMAARRPNCAARACRRAATRAMVRAMNKVFPDAGAALHDVADGAVILSGGFGLSGNPEHCIRELARRQVKRLTIVSNNCGTTDKGLGVLLAAGQVKKMIASYVGENKVFEQLFLS